MGEGPEAAGNLEEMWGMRRRRILMRSLLSREMWMVTLSPDGHLRKKKKNDEGCFFFF